MDHKTFNHIIEAMKAIEAMNEDINNPDYIRKQTKLSDKFYDWYKENKKK